MNTQQKTDTPELTVLDWRVIFTVLIMVIGAIVVPRVYGDEGDNATMPLNAELYEITQLPNNVVGSADVNLIEPIEKPRVVSIELDEQTNQLTVVYRQQVITNFTLSWDGGDGPSVRVWKDIYGVVDGKIVKVKTVQGRHIPAHTVDERIEFDE